MGKIAVTREYLEDIADSIREKNGTQETYKPSEMSDAIDNIQSGADLSEYFKATIGEGQNGRPSVLKMIKKIPSTTTVEGETLSYAFAGVEFSELPMLDTSNVTSMMFMCYNCPNLTTVPLYDTSKVTDMQSAFASCSSLKSVPNFNTPLLTNLQNAFAYSGLEAAPQINTSNVGTTKNTFSSCNQLTTVPIYNLPNNRNFQNMFTNCSKLTDTSIDNILQMCISATIYSGTKTLVILGFNSTNYPSSRIQALPHYQDFINAGWSIGY